MSLYESIHQQFASASPEEKLRILRAEMLSNIAAVQGYAALLSQIDPLVVADLPKPFGNWVAGLAKAGTDLRDILDALTAPSRES